MSMGEERLGMMKCAGFYNVGKESIKLMAE
jgi:hypothetical protein